MNPAALLLSLRPPYADAVFEGSKRIELRRVRPRLAAGTLIIIYATLPKAAIVGSVRVTRVIEKSPSALWNQHGRLTAICRQEFFGYFDQAELGYGIELENPTLWPEPLPLDGLRSAIPGFRPPQSYHYLRPDRDRKLLRHIAHRVPEEASWDTWREAEML